MYTFTTILTCTAALLSFTSSSLAHPAAASQLKRDGTGSTETAIAVNDTNASVEDLITARLVSLTQTWPAIKLIDVKYQTPNKAPGIRANAFTSLDVTVLDPQRSMLLTTVTSSRFKSGWSTPTIQQVDPETAQAIYSRGYVFNRATSPPNPGLTFAQAFTALETYTFAPIISVMLRNFGQSGPATTGNPPKNQEYYGFALDSSGLMRFYVGANDGKVYPARQNAETDGQAIEGVSFAGTATVAAATATSSLSAPISTQRESFFETA